MKKKCANNIWNIILKKTKPMASVHLSLDQKVVSAKSRSQFSEGRSPYLLCASQSTQWELPLMFLMD